jgi:mRNA-degrading endonuclease RelE of RelBE toxin-antitoxin system
MLTRLPEAAASAIIELLTGPLVESPYRLGKPMHFELEGYLCARRGAYRVVYRVLPDDIVEVVRIDHRSDVYRSR